MIGTHAPKLFNSKIKQSAINAKIIGDIPPYFICSKTIFMDQEYWALPLSAAAIGTYRVMSKEQREEEPKKIPDIEDARGVKQILLPYRNSYVSVSPVASCGVLHEINQRVFKNKIYPNKTWTIQPTMAAWSTHGEMLLNQKGKITILLKQLRNLKKNKKSFSKYITVKCRVEGMNVSSGMTAVLFPSITAIGGLIHKIEREVGQKIDFAVGFKNLDFSTSGKTTSQLKGKVVVPSLILDEITATADMILILKLDRRISDVEKYDILNYLRENPINRVAGGTTWDYSVSYEKYNDNYTFIVDCSKEVEEELQEGIDPLDIALEKYKNKGEVNEKTGVFEVTEKTGVTVNHTGYAFLEKPKKRNYTRNNYKHAWAEPIFSVVKQEKFSKNIFWTRKQKQYCVVWENCR
ncbi:hypothetical protein ACFGZ5_11805 [Pasteurella multocida]